MTQAGLNDEKNWQQIAYLLCTTQTTIVGLLFCELFVLKEDSIHLSMKWLIYCNTLRKIVWLVCDEAKGTLYQSVYIIAHQLH